jgi:hypothetical protein
MPHPVAESRGDFGQEILLRFRRMAMSPIKGRLYRKPVFLEA